MSAPRTAATPPPPPPRMGAPDDVPRCESVEACLHLVDAFLDGQPRSFGLLQTHGNLNLGGGPCGANCELPKPCAGGVCMHDTYDNALAAIYYTKRGQLGKAKEILDAFKGALYPEDLKLLRPRRPDDMMSGSISSQALTLLATTYSSKSRPIAGNYESPHVTDGNVDSGVNAWAALAFAHYAAAAAAPCYANIAREILDAISKSGTCEDSYGGFLDRLPPFWDTFRTTQGNTVIFAAAHVLGRRNQSDQAASFVRYMRYLDRYAGGTGGPGRCDRTVDPAAPVLAPATFWTVLADSDAKQEQMTGALRSVLQSPGPSDDRGLWVSDKDFVWKGGLGTAPTFHGFRYSTHGKGVQWEMTASAVMALVHFEQRFGDQGLNVQQYAQNARESLCKLLGMYKGVPASVLGGNLAASEQSRFPGGSRSGTSRHPPDLRYLTVATTAWTGLSILQQFKTGAPVNEDANPFSVPKAGVPTGKDISCILGPSRR